MFFSSERKLFLSTKNLVTICFASLVCACSFFRNSNQEDPINKVVNDQTPKEFIEPEQNQPPRDQWIEEKEISPKRKSRASEAVNEVMSADIGIISQNYLEGNAEYWVTANKLNIRSGPSSRYERVGALDKGTKVIVLERRGNWIRIEARQWVSKSHLSTEP